MHQPLRATLLALGAVVLLASGSAAQSPAADSAGIRAAALDYIEGWYAGDGARMERAVHPDLAKRIIQRDPNSQRVRLDHQSAMTLVNNTKNGGGTRTPAAQQQKDVTILDVYQNVAVAKIVANSWIDYLQLAKWNGRWVIINVLWELKPQPAQ
jgi:hypothetical protein